MNKRLASRGGYTLVELMMVVGIVGLVAALAGGILIQVQNFYFNITARNEVQRDARASLDIIDNMMRQAQASTICITSANQSPACGSIPTAGLTGGYYSGIAFTTIDGRKVAFYQNANKLMMLVNNDQSVLSRDLAYLSFLFPNTGSSTIINVALTMQKEIQLGQKKSLEMSIQKVRIMN